MSYEASKDVLYCLVDLKNQWQLNVTEKNQIEDLMKKIRNLIILLKWQSSSSYKVHDIGNSLETWLQDVENGLIQPTRNRSLAPDLLEETLLNLSRRFPYITGPDDDYIGGDFYSRGFAVIDVPIDELVMDWLDPLLVELTTSYQNGDLQEEQIKELLEKLINLKGFLKIIGKDVEKGNNITYGRGLMKRTLEDLLTEVKFLVENAIYICYHSSRLLGMKFGTLLARMNHIEPEIRVFYVQFFKDSNAEIPNNLGMDLQALVSVDSVLDNLEKLIKDQDDGSVIPSNVGHQLPVLHQELSFLRYFLMDPHLKQYIKLELESFTSLLMQVERVARKAASLTRSLCDGQKKDEMATKINLEILLEIANLLNAKSRKVYERIPKPSTSNFPQTPKLGFLNFFMQNLEELLKHRIDSIAYVKNEIETVQTELEFLRSFFVSKNPEKDDNIEIIIMDVIYEAERVIDLISATPFPSWYYMLWLGDVFEKIKLVRKQSYKEACNKKINDSSVLNVDEASIHARQPAYVTLAPEDEVVGFNDEAEKIINHLTGGTKDLDILSIVGMPGLGKTTLGKKLYEHPLVTRYFHVRSWYCISQAYERRDLLLSILGNVTELTEKIKKMSDEDLAEVLYRSLKGRRYLIVLDDIWSIEPWIDICKSFPDDCKGSRIMFTSRIREVALQANPRTSDPYYLRSFSKEESWELLKKKVFQLRDCPPKLNKIGQKIAENCKGLPLLVVLTAGILTRTEESEDCWSEVLVNMGKQVCESRQCREILELSYNHLPDHLKPCFLYLGAFAEDKEIPAWKLIRLWIAEGLVQKTESESLEEVAEGYLKDLIARSLVLVARNKCIGGIKSCRLHDLLHEFSREKAKDEQFLLILSKDLGKPTDQFRSCYHFKDSWFYEKKSPYVRSMLCSETYLCSEYAIDLSVLPCNLKLLRVLDLQHASCVYSTEIGLWVHLRFLAIRGEMDQVPLSIGNLWRLETLLVHGTEGEVKLPETLFEMEHLKHVNINKRTTFVFSSTFQSHKSSKSSIQNLSRPAFCRGDGTTEKVIQSLKHLQKLKCIFFDSCYSGRCWNRLPVLDSLADLESLNVIYHGIVKLPCELSFPSKLKKLTLSKFRIPWSEISKIGKLAPQLEVLKLFFKAFEGPRWDISDDEFSNLKVLKLESLDIMEWDVSDDAFPCLEQLVLEKCKKLKEIRSNFGELATLRRIEVQWCSYSATKSMWKIQEQQEELGSDGLKVLFLPSDWDSAPAS